MKKNIKKILIICISVLAIILITFLGLTYKWSKSQAWKCNKTENTGWAPAFGGGPIGCDGKRLDKKSPLIEDEYTCYCHTENTCWDGNTCVPLTK